MPRQWLQNVKTGQIIGIDEAEYKNWPDDKNKDWGKTEVVFLKRKSDGFEAVISADEYGKYGDAEKEQWDKLPSHEARDKAILKKAFEQVSDTETAEAAPPPPPPPPPASTKK